MEVFIDKYGLPIAELIVIGIFLKNLFDRAWTYYTTVHAPAERELERKRVDNDASMAKSFTEFGIILSQVAVKLSSMETIAADTKRILQSHVDAATPAIESIPQIKADMEALKEQSVKLIAAELAAELRSRGVS